MTDETAATRTNICAKCEHGRYEHRPHDPDEPHTGMICENAYCECPNYEEKYFTAPTPAAKPLDAETLKRWATHTHDSEAAKYGLARCGDPTSCHDRADLARALLADIRPVVLQLFCARVSVGLLADAFETTVAEIENMLRQAKRAHGGRGE